MASTNVETESEKSKLLGDGDVKYYNISENCEADDAPTSPSSGTTGAFAATFIVVNAAMGAGMLNMPKAFSDAGGILAGIMLQLGFYVFIISSLTLLGYCARKHQCCTYQEVIDRVCGKAVGTSCEVFIILYTFGTSIAMFIIVGDQLDKVIEELAGPDFCHSWYFNRKFTMSFCSTLVILPLCFPKDISFLRHASVAGVLACVCVMITVVVKFAVGGDQPPGPIRHAPRNLFEFLSALPTIFFSYQCHVSSVPVFASLRHKSMTNWIRIVVAAIVICFVTFNLTAVCGYLTFGDDVESDILQSYDASDTWVIGARVAIFIAMLFSYPVVHFCGRAAVTTLLVKLRLYSLAPSRERARRCATTACWFGLTLLLALFIPNIGEAIAVVGGLACAFIVVFPGLCFVNLAWSDDDGEVRWWLFAAGMVFAGFGAFLFGEITAAAVMSDVLLPSGAEQSQCYRDLL